MKPPTPRPPPQGLRTWQEISQRSAGRSLSPVARRKRIIQALGMVMTLLMAGALIALGAWGWKLYHHHPEQMRVADSDARLAKVDFQTNGVLTESWAREALDLKNGDLLPQYDVFVLRKHLLSSPQVQEAFVQRVLPDTLRIRISERQPLLRVAVDNGAGGYRPLLVARDGTVYEGQLYADATVNSLPWLAGVKLHHAPGSGIAPLAGMDVVEDLLVKAKASLPQAAAQWTVVDLSEFDPRPQAPLSLIKVRSPDLGDVTFLAHDFHRQLDRLALIAQDLRDKQIVTRGVDLSFDQQAVVQLAEPPAPAKTTSHVSTVHATRTNSPHNADTFAKATLRNSIIP